MKNYFDFIQQLQEVVKGGTVPWAGKTRGPYTKALQRQQQDLEADARLYADRMREMAPIYAAIDDYKAGKPVSDKMLVAIMPFVKQLGIKRGKMTGPAAKAPPPPSRPPFNWQRGGAGWWHPYKQWFRFEHDGRNYHVTQILKSPEKFGLTINDIDAALKKAAIRDHYDDPEKRVIAVKHAIMRGMMDLNADVQKLAYAKGWLKVYGGSTPSAEGWDKASFKAFIKEVGDVTGDERSIEIYRFMNLDFTRTWNYNFMTLRNKFARANFVNSL